MSRAGRLWEKIFVACANFLESCRAADTAARDSRCGGSHPGCRRGWHLAARNQRSKPAAYSRALARSAGQDPSSVALRRVESRREGKLINSASSPRPSPPFLRRRGRENAVARSKANLLQNTTGRTAAATELHAGTQNTLNTCQNTWSEPAESEAGLVENERRAGDNFRREERTERSAGFSGE